MSQVDRALAYFTGGMACSQAVFAVFAERYGLEESVAMKVATCLGGGVQSAGVCGAVSGAALVIGLKDGSAGPGDGAVRKFANEKTREFLRRFRERHTHIDCRDLLDCDITTPDGRQHALNEKLFSKKCPDYVKDAVTILQEMKY